MSALAAKIASTPSFRKRYYALLMKALTETLGQGVQAVEAWSSAGIDWNYLLFCGSVLAHSGDGFHRDCALRIAQYCVFSKSKDLSPSHKDAAIIILDILSNKLAIDLAIKKNRVAPGPAEGLTGTLKLDHVKRRIENTIVPMSSDPFFANPFQKRLWTEINEFQFLSASAPTAAGKSFALERWVYERAKETGLPVAYIVPTRALLTEIEADLRRSFPEANTSSFPDVAITSKTDVFVLTQERMLLLLSRHPGITFSALIVDEAHKLGDRQRGILLQEVIDRVRESSPSAKICFVSPLTANPESLVNDFPGERASAFQSTSSTVAQNLFWVSQIPRKPLEWEVEFCHPKRTDIVAKVELATRPGGGRERLAMLARAIGLHYPGNIIYANDASEAEAIAEILYNDDQLKIVNEPEISALIELCKHSVHRDFLLAKVLSKGVAFHYGNIPQTIRVLIERLFKANKIRYLICTSTLVEGVNTSCRNIFVRGPRKGAGNPMTDADFWNLAGRAGRWGAEFNGNIFCIDAKNALVWKNGAPKQRKPFKIERSLDRVAGTENGFIKYLADLAPNVDARLKHYEYALWQLVCGLHRTGSIERTPLGQRIGEPRSRVIERYLREISSKSIVPIDVLEKHPGISPIAASRLRRALYDNRDNLRGFQLASPADADPVDNYAKIFDFCHRHLNATALGAGRRAKSLAILVTHWARGRRIPHIIDARKAYFERNNIPYNLNLLIRRILEDIETIARFEAPRYLSCYADVFRLVAEEAGFDIDPLGTELLSEYLEFGVNLTSQLSVMRLGLSRTAAIELVKDYPRKDMDQASARAWLLGLELDGLKIPQAIKDEIAELKSLWGGAR